MPGRTDTTPLLLDGGRVLRLRRVPFHEREFDESWLQGLLFDYPSLIPVQEIEPVFAPLIPVARELPTPSGALDILYTSPAGYPTLVETKLWRNPEARREVVAQVIDYAAQLAAWSYEGLVQAVRRARKDSGKQDPFEALIKPQAQEWDHAQFVDSVSRNLARGRMLLLIVGDGIHEAIEQMAKTLSGAPHLAFTLGLVELALFRPPEKPEPLIVQPRIIARTREVVRAIVEVRPPSKPEDVHITLPDEDEEGSGRSRRTLTEEAFYERLAKQVSPGAAERLRVFLAEVENLGVTTVAREASLSLHYVEPSSGSPFSCGSIYTHGRVDMFYVVYFFRAAGFHEQIARDYLDDVARLVPNARVRVWESNTDPRAAIKVRNRHISIEEILEHEKEWLSAIERMISRINNAAGGAGRG